MNKKTILVISATFFLSGCPFDGDDGNKGQQGDTGATGLSCWDLNEDGQKNMPEEDSNNDGIVNVYDCRMSSSLSPTTTVVDSSTQSITNQHSREVYSPSLGDPNRIVVFTGTQADYLNAAIGQTWADLEVYVSDPIQDPCGLWKWVQTSSSDFYNLQAENAVAYRTLHVPVTSIVSVNPDVTSFGYEQCMSACRSDAECVGATFFKEEDEYNAMICKLLRNVGYEIDSSSEYSALQTSERGYTSGQMDGSIHTGILSVCEVSP